MTNITFASLHEKLNFLLADHQIHDFDESGLNLESVASLHAKADALCAAHGGNPQVMPDDTLAQLHPKLDPLLKGHGVDADVDADTLDSLVSVDEKLDAIIGAHDDTEESRD